jgi:hypothetical protein
MRLAVGLFASLSLAAFSQAFAADPPSQSATPQGQQPAAAAPAESAPTTSAPAAPAPTASAPAATAPTASTAPPATQPTSTAKTDKPELTPEEKNLLSQGYKLDMRGDQKYFCHSETSLGSRFPHKSCRKSEEILAGTQRSKDMTGDMQRSFVPQQTH